MGERQRIVMWIVGVGLVATGIVLASRSRGEDPAKARERIERLEQAVVLAEGNLSALLARGVEDLTPSRAAKHLVQSMNSASGPAAPIEFHEAQVFGPWQVAIVPDETRRVVRIEGYGMDATQPAVVREVAIPGGS
jgi:hypothetical protein